MARDEFTALLFPPPPPRPPHHRRSPPPHRPPRRERRRRPADGDHDDRQGESESEEKGLRVPAGDHQAADTFDQVRDRVDGRDKSEPVLLDQVPRQVDRRQKDGHEEQRERTLYRLHRTGLYREYRPYATEPEGDEQIGRAHV